MLKSMLVSGLIYITHESIDTNHTLIVPTIYIDREPLCLSSQDENVFIESENMDGGRQAVKHLVDLGCRRIALVCLEGQIPPTTTGVKAINESAGFGNSG